MDSRSVRAATRRANAERARLEEAKKRREELMRQMEVMRNEMPRHAAELERIRKEKEDLLGCPVCRENCNATNKFPCLWECGHTVCADCMIRLVARQWTEQRSVPKKDRVDIYCPSCMFIMKRMLYPLNPNILVKNEDVLQWIRANQDH
uniref:RING-type domain-containing protein n=1 Tax=Caenorhabditis tropicalis TaxID=1561998 RepID=A0A1I7TRN5_9PELO